MRIEQGGVGLANNEQLLQMLGFTAEGSQFAMTTDDITRMDLGFGDE